MSPRKVTPVPIVVTVPTPPPVQPLRGDRLGISAGSMASTEVLDGCVELGVKWVRVSHESGWSGTITALKNTVDAAHARGLKVLQCVQISGKDYSDPVKNTSLANFTVDCVRVAGCDAIEVGNEWNHRPFWLAPDVSVFPPVAQVRLSLSVAKVLRAAYPDIPMITHGLSPEADPLNPHVFVPAFWDVDLPGHLSVKWSGIGLHPYCYPELATTNPIQWNPLLQSAKIVADSKARGIGAPLWITELGAPGFAVNAPIIRGVALTEQRQADCYTAYFQVIRNNEALGVKYPLVAFATLFDGQSATNAVEKGLGLKRADRTRKPAWRLLYDFAHEVA